MRNFLIILILVSTPLLARAQFEFEPDSTYQPFMMKKLAGTELGPPYFDSIQFELRFWSFGYTEAFLQLTIDHQENWHYRRGYVNDKSQVKSMALSGTPVDVHALWKELLVNDILTLPTQNNLTYRYEKDGRTAILTPDDNATEPFIHSTLDAAAYSIQLFTKDGYRSYHYYNPEGLSKAFKNSGWSSPETDKFASIQSMLFKKFKMMEVHVESLKERIKKK